MVESVHVTVFNTRIVYMDNSFLKSLLTPLCTHITGSYMHKWLCFWKCVHYYVVCILARRIFFYYVEMLNFEILCTFESFSQFV